MNKRYLDRYITGGDFFGRAHAKASAKRFLADPAEPSAFAPFIEPTAEEIAEQEQITLAEIAADKAEQDLRDEHECIVEASRLRERGGKW